MPLSETISQMPEWKRKALALWPDLCDYLDEEDTLYVLFWELRSRCVDAHQAGNGEQLAKIYDYAEWCLNQQEEDVWNPAGVAFYEHLADTPETREGIPRWLMPEVYQQVRGLLHHWLGAEEFAKIEQEYQAQHPTWHAPVSSRQAVQEQLKRYRNST